MSDRQGQIIGAWMLLIAALPIAYSVDAVYFGNVPPLPWSPLAHATEGK